VSAQKITAWVSVPREDIEDAPVLRWRTEVVFAGALDDKLLTPEEERTGWREFTASDGRTGQRAVGWRAEQADREYAAKRAAAMAACSYVACTCGYHDEE
jgi:hypothetical protein